MYKIKQIFAAKNQQWRHLHRRGILLYVRRSSCYPTNGLKALKEKTAI